MPQCFQESFLEKVTVIIDCFEVFINRPSGLYVSTQTIFLLQEPLYCNVFDWNHTSRQYFFCFQSVGWKNSDKFLLRGDLVLADRGFTIRKS